MLQIKDHLMKSTTCFRTLRLLAYLVGHLVCVGWAFASYGYLRNHGPFQQLIRILSETSAEDILPILLISGLLMTLWHHLYAALIKIISVLSMDSKKRR